MQIQTERGLIFVEKFIDTPEEAQNYGASYSFTSHDINCDCYSRVTGENRRVFYLLAKGDKVVR